MVDILNDDNLESNNTDDNLINEITDSISDNTSSSFINLKPDENVDTYDSSATTVNCLSLTVKKDYSLSIVKNIVVRTLKGTWRVSISIFLLNLFNFFL